MIVSGTCDWYTAWNRVIPPSTISTNTRSAAASPTQGRAGPEFSTLTPITGLVRARSGSLNATPVSGQVTSSGCSVVGSTVGLDGVTTGSGSGDAQPGRARRAAATRASHRRIPPP